MIGIQSNYAMKLREIFQKKDDSPELKRGEIKEILIRTATKPLPEFKYLTYTNHSYYFQRMRSVLDLDVTEIISIQFSLKGGMMDCNIGSFLNRQIIFDGTYSSSLINPNGCLKFLKNNTGALPYEKAYYYHNGRVRTTEKVVQEIFADCQKYALPFFDKQLNGLQNNPLVFKGIDYISRLDTNKASLKKDLEEELKHGNYCISSIKHPNYLELKKLLQDIEGIDREIRKGIPKLTYDLLELYADNDKGNLHVVQVRDDFFRQIRL